MGLLYVYKCDDYKVLYCHRTTFNCLCRRRWCLSCLDQLKNLTENSVQPPHTRFQSICFWVASLNPISRTNWQDWWDGQIKRDICDWTAENTQMVLWLFRGHQPIRSQRRRAAEWLVVLTIRKWRDVRHILVTFRAPLVHKKIWCLLLWLWTLRFDKSKLCQDSAVSRFNWSGWWWPDSVCVCFSVWVCVQGRAGRRLYWFTQYPGMVSGDKSSPNSPSTLQPFFQYCYLTNMQLC